jgi:argonaute-like protein implicated in RNA metabolism and viral defense
MKKSEAMMYDKKYVKEMLKNCGCETNFMQVIDLSYDEKVDMYMKLSKKELIEMLINCNDILSKSEKSSYEKINKSEKSKCSKCGGDLMPSIWAYSMGECKKCGHIE